MPNEAGKKSLLKRLSWLAPRAGSTLNIVIPLLILILAGGIAISLVKTAPRPERQPKPRLAPLVESRQVILASHSIDIEAWGLVQPAEQITLRSQVDGRIIEIKPEFVPGGHFEHNDVILRIDPTDYVLARQQRQSDLEKAKAALLLEQGNQVVAQQEFKLLGESLSDQEQTLVLRIPQLNTARAAVAAATAALQSAKLALSRTVVKAPFDANVLRRHVNLGTYATTTTDLGTLVGTREYWVELVVPLAQLRWITIPQTSGQTGSTVRLYHDHVWGTGMFRTGQVIRLLTDLETEGRMARLLVAIKDPLTLHGDDPNAPRVLLGTYLRAEIQGRTIPDIAKVERHWIRDQDTVWLVKGDQTLEIRKVNIAHRGIRHVIVSEGLHKGDRLIITNLPSPTEGMPLRLMNVDHSQAPKDPTDGH